VATNITAPDDVDVQLERRFAALDLLAAQNTPEGLPIDPEDAEDAKVLRERLRQIASPEENRYDNGPIMKITTGYTMTKEQHERWRIMYPRIRLDPGLAFTGHDHPLAHAATLVGIRYIQNMFRPGARICDIYGNPTANEKTNRYFYKRSKRARNPVPAPTIDTYVNTHTAADYVRSKTKWGPERGPDGTLRWMQADMQDIPVEKYYDTYLGIHTLYYSSMPDVAKFMSQRKDARFLALVNYDPNPDAKLFGELHQTKVSGVTTQTSPNGEKYTHANIDPWFRQHSFATSTKFDSTGTARTDGIAWTIHSLGGPMHVIEIVYADPALCQLGHVRDAQEVDETHLVIHATGVRTLWHAYVNARDESTRLVISNYGLAAELRHWMTLRERSVQTFKDLCIKARRMTGPDIVQGAKQYEVEPGLLADHIVYAYLVDAPGEKVLMDGVKMLRGELLLPLNEGLALAGPDSEGGLFDALHIGFRRIFGMNPVDRRPRGLSSRSSNGLTTRGKVDLSKLTRR
jgi:hypothetical protein